MMQIYEIIIILIHINFSKMLHPGFQSPQSDRWLKNNRYVPLYQILITTAFQ